MNDYRTERTKPEKNKILHDSLSLSHLLLKGKFGGEGSEWGFIDIYPIVLSSLLKHTVHRFNAVRLMLTIQFYVKEKSASATAAPKEKRNTLNTFNALNMLNETDSFYLDCFSNA